MATAETTTQNATESPQIMLNGEAFKQNDIVYFAPPHDLIGIKTGIIDVDGGVFWVMADLDRYYLLNELRFVSHDLRSISLMLESHFLAIIHTIQKNVESKMIGEFLQKESAHGYVEGMKEEMDFQFYMRSLYENTRQAIRQQRLTPNKP